MRTVLVLVMGLLVLQALTGCGDSRQAVDSSDPATGRSLVVCAPPGDAAW